MLAREHEDDHGSFPQVSRLRSLTRGWPSEAPLEADEDPIVDVLSGIALLQAGQKRVEVALFDLQSGVDTMLEGVPTGAVTIVKEPCNFDADCAKVAPGPGFDTAPGPETRRAKTGLSRLACSRPQDLGAGDRQPFASMALGGGHLEGEQHAMGSVMLTPLTKQATGIADPTEEDWPACVEIHDCFKEAHDKVLVEAAEQRYRTQCSEGLDKFSMQWVISSNSSAGVGITPRTCRPVMDPDSWLSFLVKVLTMLALVHDLIAIPYILAWEVYVDSLQLKVAEAAAGFWAVDVFLTFFTGFYHDGEMERHLRVIAKRYLRGWFPIEIVAVLGDFASLMPIVRNYPGRRFLLRTPGLLRSHKIAQSFDFVLERTRTEFWRLTLQFLRMVVFLMWLNHIIGCAWYSVGINAPTDTGGRWMDTLQIDSVDGYHDEDMTYRYSTSYHWAIGQIVSGGVENLSPVNSYERAFSILILLFGLFVFTTILSIFNATMTNWTIMQQEQTSRMRALREFLTQNNVSQRTCTRVQKQLTERLKTRCRLVEKDVDALCLLSSKLRAELQFEVSGPCVQKHPVFYLCACVNQHTMKAVCGDAVGSVMKLPGDLLFRERTIAGQTFLLKSGSMSYTLSMSIFPLDEDLVEEVEVDSWLCEAALWTRWSHVGLAEASSNTELVAIRVSRLLFELLKHETIAIMVRDYAVQFHSRLVDSSSHNHGCWPTDLRVPDTGFVDLVLRIDPSVQSIVGRVSLLDARNRQVISPEALDKLQEELDRNKCAIMMNQRELYRAVTIVVLNLENDRGEVFAQVGKWESGKLTESCTLPGVKQKCWASAVNGIEQLLEHLSPLAGVSHVTHNEQKVECKPSGTLGVITRYTKDVHFAVVDTPPERMPLEVPLMHKDRPPKYTIYGVRQKGKDNDYDLLAWLPRAEYDRLSESKSAKEVVGAWIKLLDLDTLPSIAPESAIRVAKKLRKVDGIESTAAHLGAPANGLDDCLPKSGPKPGDDFFEAGAGATVTVVRALGLGYEDLGQCPHPYCKVSVADGDAVRTHAAQSTADPVWECDLRLPGAGAGDLLEFEVWDSFPEAPGRGPGLLGRASLRLEGGVLETRLSLEDGPEGGGGLLVVRVRPGALAPSGATAPQRLAAEEPTPEAPPDAVAPSCPGKASRWEVSNWSVPDTPRPAALPDEKSRARTPQMRTQASEPARTGRALPLATVPAAVWEPGCSPEEGAAASPGTWRDSLATYARMHANGPEDCGQV